MPTRGYRKGVSDTKVAAPRRIHTRLSSTVHAALVADSASRNLPASDIIRRILTAHYNKVRLELPQPRGNISALLRELARLGNNVNQIAHNAHLGRLHLLVAETRACLAEINAAARRIVG